MGRRSLLGKKKQGACGRSARCIRPPRGVKGTIAWLLVLGAIGYLFNLSASTEPSDGALLASYGVVERGATWLPVREVVVMAYGPLLHSCSISLV